MTWGIGLLPILIIRFLLVRRAVGKFPAASICFVFLILNVMIFEALGSQSKTHGALMLVTFVSFYILRYKTNSNKNEDIQKAEEALIEKLDLINCLNCGANNKISLQREQSSFACKFCGHDLQKALDVRDSEEKLATTERGDRTERVATDLSNTICSFCDTENKPDAKYCRRCGENLHVVVEETVMYCEKCGNEFASEDSFCQKDGTALTIKKNRP